MAITKYQLKLQIDRLIDVFGEKSFSDQRELMIWEAVEGLAYPQVIGIVDHFIRSSKNAPLPQDFVEAAKGFERQGRKRPLGELQDDAKCADCDDSGFVMIERLEKFESWAHAVSGSAACHCTRGSDAVRAARANRSSVTIGQWNDAWKSSYRIFRSKRKLVG
jgi:hypothetical protein